MLGLSHLNRVLSWEVDYNLHGWSHDMAYSDTRCYCSAEIAISTETYCEYHLRRNLVFPLTTIYYYFPSMFHMLAFFTTPMDRISPIVFINLIHISGALYYIYLCVKKYTSWWFSPGTRFSN